MKNLCLFWRLDLWYKEKFVSLEIVYFGRHATFTQVSLNCRLDTRVDLLKCVTATGPWSLTNPTVQWRYTSFYSEDGCLNTWWWAGDPGATFFQLSQLSDKSLLHYSLCHFVPTFRFQPMQFIWCWTVLSVQSHRPPLHTLVEPICELLPVGDMTRSALHYSPVSRDDTLSHLHFQHSLALQRDIRLLTCLDYCFVFFLWKATGWCSLGRKME